MILKDFKKKFRKATPKQNNDGCYICGQTRNTENNHLVRVVDHADICWENDYFDIRSLYVPTCEYVQ